MEMITRQSVVCILIYIVLVVQSKDENVENKGLNICLHKTQCKKECFVSNSLEDLSKNITNDGFSYIDMSNNSIPILHEGLLVDIFEIKKIELTNCNISILQQGAFVKVSYTHLTLRENKLQKVDQGVFTNHKSLETIYLDRNSIEFIDKDAFANMTSLRLIDIGNNRIKNWNPDWFAGLHLVVLKFSDNLIEELPDFSFKFDNEVALIDMRRNKIKNISSEAFHGLSEVDAIFLGSNQLTEFGEHLLENTNVHYSLEIAGNQIQCLPQNLTAVFKASCTYIKSNPFSCDCSKRIKDYAKKHNYCLNEDFDKTC